MALLSPTHEINMVVRHDPPPPGLVEIQIPKAEGDKLGISIRGGARSQAGNPLDKTDEGVFISKVGNLIVSIFIFISSSFMQIQPGGAVAKDGRLKVGQRILEVNGQSLLGADHQEAVRALRSVGNMMTIMICDGFDPALIEEPKQSKKLGSKSLSLSVSSIDCDDEEAYRQRKVSCCLVLLSWF
jgi:protein scribble